MRVDASSSNDEFLSGDDLVGREEGERSDSNEGEKEERGEWTNLRVHSNDHIRTDSIHDVGVSSLSDSLDVTVLDAYVGLDEEGRGTRRDGQRKRTS